MEEDNLFRDYDIDRHVTGGGCKTLVSGATSVISSDSASLVATRSTKVPYRKKKLSMLDQVLLEEAGILP